MRTYTNTDNHINGNPYFHKDAHANGNPYFHKDAHANGNPYFYKDAHTNYDSHAHMDGQTLFASDLAPLNDHIIRKRVLFPKLALYTYLESSIKEGVMTLEFSSIVILVLLAFIAGMIIGVRLSRPAVS